jgi:hypothetical protein
VFSLMAWSKFVATIKHTKKSKKSKSTLSIGLTEDECQVCLETKQCLSTSTCNHPICVTCLGTCISVTHKWRIPCPCPFSAICKGEFTIDDIAPFVDDELLGKIWRGEAEKQIEKGLGMYCPRQNCSKPILWKEKTANKRNGAGKCRSCGQPVCMPCKSALHDNLTYLR